MALHPTASQPPAPNAGGHTSPGLGTPGELMAVWSETFLAPIMARMAEQETTIREQAETIGELRATVATQDARIATLTAPTSTEGQKPSNRAVAVP